MKRSLLLFCMLVLGISAFGQKYRVSGKVKDIANGEELIGATVTGIKNNLIVRGTTTDIGGNYTLDLPAGNYTIRVTYISYDTTEKLVIVQQNSQVDFDIKANTTEVEEVVVTADVAKARETPVAYTNVTQKKLAEELGSRDLPMVLNTTPGVYATQQGGGAGDARVTIRGFNQRNIAVMVDGIPVNDMENGQVYWSNWFGLSEVTRTMQVQRGLGVSKIANPAVGGTINIITKGIESRPSYAYSLETGNNGYFKASIGGTSGRMKNGFGITYALTYRRSDGYVDALFDNMFAYFLKIDKKIGRHTLSLAGMGAPQSHGQRSFRARLSVYDKAYARQEGIDTTIAGAPSDKGRRYNQHWGYLNGTRFNERVNYFHKPQIYLKDVWEINKKMFLSSVLYASYGNGGGTAAQGVSQNPQTGQYNFQAAFQANTVATPFYNPIDPLYSTTERKSTGFLYSNVNNHKWYGLLSTMNYQLNKNINISGGVDFRYYKGIHYRTPYDLLGGDYLVDNSDQNQTTPMKRIGDKFRFNYESTIKWGGIFGEIEYKTTRYSTFLSLTSTLSTYERTDFLKRKDPVSGEYNTSPTKQFIGYTIKSGFNYNLTEHWNVYTNAGFLSRPPRFNNVFDDSNNVIAAVKSEMVTSIELGLGYRSRYFSANFNAYHTNWLNKPADFLPIYYDADGNAYKYNINGMRALHKGIEVDLIYKLTPRLDIEAALGVADWRWKSGDTVRITDDAGNVLSGGEFYFSAKNVHVGDAAQTQATLQLRWEPIRRFYIKPSVTWFARNYADFDPSALKGAYANHDSWQLPNYTLVNIHAGYGRKLNKTDIIITASVFNVFDAFYISDAQHRSTGGTPAETFNPKNVEVFVGPGTTWNLGLKALF